MKFNFLTPGMNIREYVTLNENIDRSQRDVKYFFKGFRKVKVFIFRFRDKYHPDASDERNGQFKVKLTSLELN